MGAHTYGLTWRCPRRMRTYHTAPVPSSRSASSRGARGASPPSSVRWSTELWHGLSSSVDPPILRFAHPPTQSPTARHPPTTTTGPGQSYANCAGLYYKVLSTFASFDVAAAFMGVGGGMYLGAGSFKYISVARVSAGTARTTVCWVRMHGNRRLKSVDARRVCVCMCNARWVCYVTDVRPFPPPYNHPQHVPIGIHACSTAAARRSSTEVREIFPAPPSPSLHPHTHPHLAHTTRRRRLRPGHGGSALHRRRALDGRRRLRLVPWR